MFLSRRSLLRRGLLAAAAIPTAHTLAAQAPSAAHEPSLDPDFAFDPGPVPYVPVETPDVPRLPWRLVDGVKEFALRCELVERQFVPWRAPFNTWSFNGSCPGPTIEVVEGDRLRFIVDNHLPEETAIHWHGLEVSMEQDGVPGLGGDPIAPGGRQVYEFTVHQHGTFFYHSHFPMQEMMGMLGFFIIHPRRAHLPHCHRDFAIALQEWAILPNNQTPNTLAMEFNWLTLNGRSGPATTPMLVRQGERVRIRFINLGMDHHPMHLHGNTWWVTGTEGGRIPRSAWRPGNTEIVGVAQARDVEFEAKFLGDWMLHCHLPHHMMNHMASLVGPLSDLGSGIETGHGMEEGMGMFHGAHATDSDLGPSLGRTLGTGDAEQAVVNGGLIAPGNDGPDPHGEPSGHGGHGAHGGADGHRMSFHSPRPNARSVPGYPQDMFMVMDREVEKPETYGLRPTWTGAMMGMMTLIRVLTPEMYDHIQALKTAARRRAVHPSLTAEEVAP